MRRSIIAAILFLTVALIPQPARAQGYLAPFVGFDFGGDAGNCPSFLNDCSEKRTAYGFAAGYLSHGVFGVEEVLSYAPDFFGKSPTFGSNSVLTLMSNLIIALPAGPVHPYVSGGVGLVRTKVDSLGSLLGFSNSGFGYNLGGGVMAMLPAHLGLRVDFRHVRSASDLGVGSLVLQGSKLNFSKITFGVVLH